MKLSVILSVIILTFLIGMIILVKYCFDTNKSQKELLKKVSKIESNLDVLYNKKDSIKTIIIATEKEIDKNNKDYEKVVNTIINSNDSINYIWAKQYIEEYKKQHFK